MFIKFLPIILGSLLTVLFIIALNPVARRLLWVDKPDNIRKLHIAAVPLTGGVAMMLAFTLTLWWMALFTHLHLLSAMLIMCLMGFLDDIYYLSARLRIFLQCCVGVMLTVTVNLSMSNLGNLFGGGPVLLGETMGMMFTVFCIVGAMNAINMIDGVDGLAGGVVLVALLWMVYLTSLVHLKDTTVLLTLIGSVSGYLIFNKPLLRGKKAVVFMGDAGSMILGVALAWLLIRLSQSNPERGVVIPPVLGLWLIAVPLLDTLSVIISRGLGGRSPFKADRNHVHHILMRAGCSETCVLIVVVLVAFIIGGVGVFGWVLGLSEETLLYGLLLLFAAYYYAIHHHLCRIVNQLSPDQNKHNLTDTLLLTSSGQLLAGNAGRLGLESPHLLKRFHLYAIPLQLPQRPLVPLMTALMLALMAAASFVLGGCSLAPGQFMNKEELGSGVSTDNIHVELVPITPQLIMQEDAARTKPAIAPELLNYVPTPYLIGANDVLYVTVWDHPELTTPAGSQQQTGANGRTVRPNGELFYPYVGNIMVKGMSLEDLSAKLTADLSKYIDKPQVDVSILSFESQKVMLSGAFKNTMPLKLTTTPISLVEAMGIGGVDTADVDLSAVQLTRDGKTYVLDVFALNRDSADLSKVFLKDKDMIHLNYNYGKKIFVLGEVKQQSSLSFKADSVSLSDAIGSVGGLDQSTSDGNAVYVIRGMDDLENSPVKIFQLNAKSALGFVLASRFRLKSQDVVYVGSTKISQWNRVIAELLPSAALLKLGTSTAVDVHDM